MKLELTDREQKLLLELVEREQKQIIQELDHTDSRDYKAILRDRLHTPRTPGESSKSSCLRGVHDVC